MEFLVAPTKLELAPLRAYNPITPFWHHIAVFMYKKRK